MLIKTIVSPYNGESSDILHVIFIGQSDVIYAVSPQCVHTCGHLLIVFLVDNPLVLREEIAGWAIIRLFNIGFANRINAYGFLLFKFKDSGLAASALGAGKVHATQGQHVDWGGRARREEFETDE